jgi:hypothetical protein
VLIKVISPRTAEERHRGWRSRACSRAISLVLALAPLCFLITWVGRTLTNVSCALIGKSIVADFRKARRAADSISDVLAKIADEHCVPDSPSPLDDEPLAFWGKVETID